METQIVDDILNGIISGKYEYGEKLPSENVLCNRYHVPRIVVRNAYIQLEERGYVRSVQGKGRFLSQPKQHVELDLRSDKSFTEKIRALGADLTTYNMGVKPVEPNGKIREALKARRDESIWSIALLRVINEEPIALHTSYVREKLFPDIPKNGDSVTSMYAFFSAKGLKNFNSTHTTMNVTLPTLTEQEMLGCPSLVPLMLLEYCTIADGDLILQYNKIVYRADRFKYTI